MTTLQTLRHTLEIESKIRKILYIILAIALVTQLLRFLFTDLLLGSAKIIFVGVLLLFYLVYGIGMYTAALFTQKRQEYVFHVISTDQLPAIPKFTFTLVVVFLFLGKIILAADALIFLLTCLFTTFSLKGIALVMASFALEPLLRIFAFAMLFDHFQPYPVQFLLQEESLISSKNQASFAGQKTSLLVLSALSAVNGVLFFYNLIYTLYFFWRDLTMNPGDTYISSYHNIQFVTVCACGLYAFSQLFCAFLGVQVAKDPKKARTAVVPAIVAIISSVVLLFTLPSPVLVISIVSTSLYLYIVVQIEKKEGKERDNQAE